jgi:PAT family beta-lactamase induction signal transducer AmpG
MSTLNHRRHPFSWIPTLYLAEGLPNVIVVTVALVMFKRLGLDNAQSSFYVAWLYLPWVIKPFWSPFVELFKTKRWWIITMQALMGASLAGVALSIPTSAFMQWSLVFLWLIAFSSATHDIAADGFYMLELSTHEQALYCGLRNTFYRIANITGQGVLIMMAGALEDYTGQPVRAWSITFAVAAAIFLLITFYHAFMLPRPNRDISAEDSIKGQSVWSTFANFFRKPGIICALLFMLLYRFPEALLTPVSKLFLIEPQASGGLGLTTTQVGVVSGTVGVIGLLLGGILGGIVIAKDGFGHWKWPMVAAISIPNIVYVYLAYCLPENIWLISSCILIEQFGYGFGFTVYMMFLLYFAKGQSETAHYAFCTGFMALSMMLPGMFAGHLQELLGYSTFFILVCLLCPITCLVTKWIKVDPKFGKK